MDRFLQEDQIEIEILNHSISEARMDIAEHRTWSKDVDRKDKSAVDKHTRQKEALDTRLDALYRDLRALVRSAAKSYDDRIAVVQQRIKDTPQLYSTTSTAPGIANPTLTSTPPTSNPLKITMPSRFDGTMSKYSDWRFQCLDVLSTWEGTPSDNQKITFIGSLMDGRALTWYRLRQTNRQRQQGIPETEAPPEELARRQAEFSNFIDDLDEKFVDPKEVQKNREAILDLKQGSMDFDEYVIQYENMAAKAEQDLDNLVVQFIRSLNVRVKQSWDPEGGIQIQYLMPTLVEVLFQSCSREDTVLGSFLSSLSMR
ncbi:hypothetical protein SeMB42_g00644 [Synchytrium endobioticum]|uniref:Retrotransposon gag domain-containing protein n=1 Tax=Synchytrium endobioticum TaxID=286115 RepID=A0A507DPJ6_9FUNG|nr:hypothetical protein SeMB42_g00644 [Synchytrium endobioticum]